MNDGSRSEPVTSPESGGVTGHTRVDAALAALDRSASLPPAAQVAVYAQVHQQLQETLGELDEGS